MMLLPGAVSFSGIGGLGFLHVDGGRKDTVGSGMEKHLHPVLQDVSPLVGGD